MPGEDLLRDHPQRPRRPVAGDGRQVEGRRLRVTALQPLEVANRIVEPVRVIDAQPVDLAGRGELEEELVRRVEHRLFLHPERGEVVDVKEAAVVDLVGGDAPEREPVRLRFEQLVQALERVRRAGLAVDQAERALDRGGGRRVLAGHLREPTLLEL